MKAFIILLMIFCHILDDYKIQAGVLNNLKQKAWWIINTKDDPRYRYDYVAGLTMHAISWSFMIMLPIAIFHFGLDVNKDFIIAFVINTIIHAFVDDLKANRGKINLLVDQSIHMIQIFITANYFL